MDIMKKYFWYFFIMTLKIDLNTGPNPHYCDLEAEKLVHKILPWFYIIEFYFEQGRGYISFFSDFRLKIFMEFFQKNLGALGPGAWGPMGGPTGAQGHGPQGPMGLKDLGLKDPGPRVMGLKEA